MALSAKDLEKLKAEFAGMDTNGDGFITKEELREMFVKSLGEADNEEKKAHIE
jgi:Ca2+-binding EF-hand superfamily protein